jgi:hypothetical protein
LEGRHVPVLAVLHDKKQEERHKRADHCRDKMPYPRPSKSKPDCTPDDDESGGSRKDKPMSASQTAVSDTLRSAAPIFMPIKWFRWARVPKPEALDLSKRTRQKPG